MTSRAIANNMIWQVLERGYRVGVNLVTLVILSRLLPPRAFGSIAIINVMVSLGISLNDGTFGARIIQSRTLRDQDVAAAFYMSLAVAIVLAVAVAAGSPWAASWFRDGALASLLPAVAIILPLSTIGTISNALLQRHGRFAVTARSSVAAQTLGGLVSIALAFVWRDAWALVAGLIVAIGVEAILNFARGRFGLRTDAQAFRDTMREGSGFTLYRALTWANGNVDRVVIGRAAGPAQLGLYGRSSAIMTNAVALLGGAAFRALFSGFSAMQDRKEELRAAMSGTLGSIMLLSVPAAWLLSFNAAAIVEIVLGPRWHGAIPVVAVLAWLLPARLGQVVMEAAMLGMGLVRAAVLRQAALLAMTVGFTVIGARYGIAVAAAGVTAAYWLYYLLCVVSVAGYLNLPARYLVGLHLRAMALPLVGLLIASAVVVVLAPPGAFFRLLVSALLLAVTGAAILALPGRWLSPEMLSARHRARRVLDVLSRRRRHR